ncbi:hypothetical protein K1T71_015301 [Dendrolimus kikuchii]|nr:hypothetical protein K1T71_015301 [Dendrolimus kikuchii]
MANKSYSDSDECINLQEDVIPPSFVSARIKKPIVHVSKTDFDVFKNEMKEMMSSMFLSQQKELRNISSTQKEIQKTNIVIENSIANLSLQQDEFKKKINILEGQIKEDRKKMFILEERMEEIQRSSRKSNFEIRNVPKQNIETKENLIEMTITLSKTVGGSLSKNDIKDIYRVKAKSDKSKNTPIIVETSTCTSKMDLLKLCKTFNIRNKSKLRAIHLGLRRDEDTPIFVAEQLTIKGSRLHFLARDLAKSKQYKFCWTSFGKVYVRKDENSPIILLNTEAQIQELMQK